MKKDINFLNNDYAFSLIDDKEYDILITEYNDIIDKIDNNDE